MFALWSLLLSGVLPMDSHAAAAPGATICYGGAQTHQAPAGPHHHDGMCQTCCLMHGQAHAAILADAPRVRPPVRVAVTSAHSRPGARAPPAQADDAAYPRGPPKLA